MAISVRCKGCGSKHKTTRIGKIYYKRFNVGVEGSVKWVKKIIGFACMKCAYRKESRELKQLQKMQRLGIKDKIKEAVQRVFQPGTIEMVD